MQYFNTKRNALGYLEIRRNTLVSWSEEGNAFKAYYNDQNKRVIEKCR